MKVLTITLCLMLGGCLGMPEQKLADGESGCVTYSGMQGSISQVRTRTDNPGKGGGSGKTRITCGSAVMEIDSTVGAAPIPAKP